MSAQILDGLHVAKIIKNNIKDQVKNLKTQNFRIPGLAAILVGEDPASKLYVKRKCEACAEVGFYSQIHLLQENISEDELLALICDLNNNDSIDGILVQLPLPKHISSEKIIENIAINKDIDGFHPYNFGKLAQGYPGLRPCTPYGIIQLLEYYNIPIFGKNALIIGTSNIVGKPMGLEFLLKKATLTYCHKATTNLESLIKNADLIVTATGKYNIVKPEYLKAHQIIIDVGIHKDKNNRIHGDIDFDSAKSIVSWISPVPGGIGPMTIATLLQNTFLSYNLNNREHNVMAT